MCLHTHTYTYLCTYAICEDGERAIDTNRHIYFYFDKQEKLISNNFLVTLISKKNYLVRETICGWNLTNVLVAIWHMRVSHCVIAPQITITTVIIIVIFLGQKKMLGFLINITKINLATKPNLAATRHRYLFNRHRAHFNQLSPDTSFLTGLLWITHQRLDWDQWYFFFFQSLML